MAPRPTGTAETRSDRAAPHPLPADCAPAASIGGDEGLATEVRELLALRGVSSEVEAGCPILRAQLVAAEAGIRVVVTGPAGRVEVRLVSDTLMAATIVESWARRDIEDPLLSRRGMTAPAADPREPIDPETPLARSSDSDREAATFSLGAALHASRGGDGSSWLAPELDGCFFVGPVCAGALIRGKYDLRVSGGSAALDSEREGVDVLLLAEMPLKVGGLAVSPGAGLGGGWFRSRYGGDGAVGGAMNMDAAGIRLEARVGLRVPVIPSLAFDATVRLDLSPLAHVETYEEGGLQVAGEPLWSLGAGVGFRYGGP